MNRRTFLRSMASAAVMSGVATQRVTASVPQVQSGGADGTAPQKHPRAITMCEFSWIERRWPGAGYEDWDEALDELVVRGYDAVRIDPFPHLLAADPHKTWTLRPEWNTQMWGSPDVNRIVLLPALFDFLGKCRERGIMVGLSTWYRQDDADTRMTITGPEVMAANWIKTLDLISQAGLIDSILYTDLCNEWPGGDWAPFMKPLSYGDWSKAASLEYMHKVIALVRAKYPQMPLLFSCAEDRPESYLEHDLSDFDLLDPHIWMVQQNDGEFYKLAGYGYERFDAKGYTNLSLKAEDLYRARPEYWQKLLVDKIDRHAAVSHQMKMPLITTECWGSVDYKDWPLLRWDWVKDLCALGAQRAAGSGQWLAVATSNFCGPQFVGMWRDKAWHQELTHAIKTSEIAPALRQGRLYERL
ncbi:MAG TPA: cellulase-like family protein [Dongiaceae bacterium]|nr:cellulase-like family protein [Dongiaceae bacterium]